jgi:hypothetical protein
VNDLYNENYKTLKKEIKENSRRQKDFAGTYIGRINIVETTILLKVNYIFNAILTKIPMMFCTKIEKSTLAGM